MRGLPDLRRRDGVALDRSRLDDEACSERLRAPRALTVSDVRVRPHGRVFAAYSSRSLSECPHLNVAYSDVPQRLQKSSPRSPPFVTYSGPMCGGLVNPTVPSTETSKGSRPKSMTAWTMSASGVPWALTVLSSSRLVRSRAPQRIF